MGRERVFQGGQLFVHIDAEAVRLFCELVGQHIAQGDDACLEVDEARREAFGDALGVHGHGRNDFVGCVREIRARRIRMFPERFAQELAMGFELAAHFQMNRFDLLAGRGDVA